MNTPLSEPPASPVIPEPWEMQSGEPVEAFAAFVEYRDAGPGRSLAKVGQNRGKSVSVLEEWSARWKWVSRTRQWVAEIDRIRREAAVELLLDMQRRHLQAAQGFIERVSKRLETMDVKELTPMAMARWFEVAVKVERLTLGEETDIVRQKFTQMTDADLIEYLRRNAPVEWLLPASTEEPLIEQEGDVEADA